MCLSNNSQTLSRWGLFWGLLSLGTLLIAFISNVWLYTKEPVRFTSSDISTTVTFKIGLWRICTSFKRSNSTYNLHSPPCTMVKYSPWDDITSKDLGIPAPVEFTPDFLSRMRYSTPFEVTSIVLILIATGSAVIGHCKKDHKTLIACGLFMLGGLTLGGGLLIFASVLSDAYFERPKKQQTFGDAMENLSSSSTFDYKYGWCFFAAGAAFIMTEVAAVLSISAYIRRFPTVEDMVRVMVPGAERRLREHQGVSGEYLVQHQHKYQRHKPDASASLSSGLNTKCYSKTDVLLANDVEGVEGPLLLSKTAPDICTSNPPILTDDGVDFTGPATTSNIVTGPGGGHALKSEPTFILDESNGLPSDNMQIRSSNITLAGQTVPIVLMHHPHRPSTTSASGSSSIPPYLLVGSQCDAKRGYNVSTLPHREKSHALSSRPDPRFCNTATLPNKHHRCGSLQGGVATLDAGFVPKKIHGDRDFDRNLSLTQRFGTALSHLSSGLDSTTSNLIGSFPSDGGIIHSGVLGPSTELPGTSSTTSSSSGGTGTTSGSCLSTNSNKSSYSSSQRKKSVTIGSVFSTMDTFDAGKAEDDLFGGASAV